MNVDTLKKILWLLCSLVQVLVLNHVHLFGVATPLLYIYFIIIFQRNYPQIGRCCCGDLLSAC